MLRLSEDKLLVVGSMKMQPLPVSGLPSVPKFERAKLQSPGEFKGAPFVESEPFAFLNVKDRSDAEACAGGDASVPAFGKLRMLTSEACHKKFVIFDRCEGNNTVILHPSWLNSPPYCSMPHPCFAGDCCADLQSSDHKSKKAKFDFHSSASLTTVGLQMPVCNEASGMKLQWKMASSNKERCSLIDFVNSGHAQNLKKEITNAGFLSDIEEDSHNEFHENTEEIDALLSSDDELSTGHSPSDESSNSLSEAKNGHGHKSTGKKRKLGYSIVDEVDDADSGPHEVAPDLPFRNSKRSGSVVSLGFLGESGPMDSFSGVEVSKVCNRGEKSSAVNVVFAEKSECESMECSGHFGGGPAGSSKRIKIKNYVQQLKSVVPGVDCLDMAGVLGQTIQYVKCLQRRLRDLEAVR